MPPVRGQLARLALRDVDPELLSHDLDVALHGEVHAILVLEYVHAEVVDDRILVEIDGSLDLEACAKHIKELSHVLAERKNLTSCRDCTARRMQTTSPVMKPVGKTAYAKGF